jgi:hypothetical protein
MLFKKVTNAGGNRGARLPAFAFTAVVLSDALVFAAPVVDDVRVDT